MIEFILFWSIEFRVRLLLQIGIIRLFERGRVGVIILESRERSRPISNQHLEVLRLFSSVMFSKLRQTVFFAGFGLVCCIFVFFVPFSSKPQVVEEEVVVSSGGENVVEEVKNQIFTGVLHI